MVDGIPYAHPIFIIIALMLGSWLPALARIANNLSRGFVAFCRRF